MRLPFPLSPSGQPDRLHQIAAFFFLLLPFMLVVFRVGAEICMGVVGALFLARSFLERDWGWVRQPFTWLVAATWLWLVLAVSPFALSPPHSFSRALPWFRLPLLFIAATYWLLKDAPTARRTAKALVWLLLFIVADTLLQYATGRDIFGHTTDEDRLTGPFNNVKVGIYIAKIMFPVLGFLLWNALRKGRRRLAYRYIAFLLACAGIILLSGERTAFATTAIGLFIAVGAGMWVYRRFRLPLLGLTALAVALASLLVVTQPTVQRRAVMLVENIQHFEESPYGRVARASLALAPRYALHGVGMHNFERACQPLMQEEQLVDYCETHPHNPYMEWLVETGVPGLLLFVALVGWMVAQPVKLWRGNRSARILAAFGLAVMVVHFFPLMSASSTASNWPAMLLWYSLSLTVGFLRIAERRP